MTAKQEAEIKAALTEEQAVGLTMLAEAAGDLREGHSSVEERIAVGWVISNRRTQAGALGFQQGSRKGQSTPTYRAICLARKQFSCWNEGTDANHVRLMALAQRLVAGLVTPRYDPILAETIYLARGIMAGTILDRTGGATHYYAPAAMKPAGAKPFWVFLNGKAGAEHVPTARIGSQVFYKGV